MEGLETEKEDFGLFLSGLFRSRPQSAFRVKIPCLGILNSLLCDTLPLKPLVTSAFFIHLRQLPDPENAVYGGICTIILSHDYYAGGVYVSIG